MLNRRNLGVLFVALLLMSALAGCMAGGVQVPDREVMISVDDALAAQNAGMAGLAAGSAEWTEGQFSSLLSVLLEQNTGSNNPISGIHVWFEPGNEIYIRVAMPDVLPIGDTLDLKGTIGVMDNHLAVDIQEAAAGSLGVSGGMLAPVNAQINAALSDPSMGIAADVTTGEGTITLSLGGM